MKVRKALIAVGAAASLAVVPSTAFAGNRSNDDCRDGSKWKDYKYAPQCECECPDEDKCDYRDKDHRDKVEKKVYREYEPKKETRKSPYTGRVLKTA